MEAYKAADVPEEESKAVDAESAESSSSTLLVGAVGIIAVTLVGIAAYKILK